MTHNLGDTPMDAGSRLGHQAEKPRQWTSKKSKKRGRPARPKHRTVTTKVFRLNHRRGAVLWILLTRILHLHRRHWTLGLHPIARRPKP